MRWSAVCRWCVRIDKDRNQSRLRALGLSSSSRRCAWCARLSQSRWRFVRVATRWRVQAAVRAWSSVSAVANASWKKFASTYVSRAAMFARQLGPLEWLDWSTSYADICTHVIIDWLSEWVNECVIDWLIDNNNNNHHHHHFCKAP